MSKHKKLTTEETKERQRKWAVKRKYEIRDYLLNLGKVTFDKRN